MDIFNEYIYVLILMAAICGTQFVLVFDVIYVDTTKDVNMKAYPLVNVYIAIENCYL